MACAKCFACVNPGFSYLLGKLDDVAKDEGKLANNFFNYK
jgi:hypothetical protein